MGVAYTATSLAMRHGADMEKAEVAGLLHDCAKYMDVDKMEQLCRKGGIELSEMEIGNPSLLHSKAGSVLAQTRYGYSDPEILDAIRYHTTGRPLMTTLDKIIFIADYIEPGRCVAPNLPEIRRLAFEDLDAALRKILQDTLDYLPTTGKAIDPMTQRTYDYYNRRTFM